MAHLPKGPGKSSSNKINNYDEPEVALGKQNERAACPKDKLEFKFSCEPCRVCPMQYTQDFKWTEKG